MTKLEQLLQDKYPDSEISHIQRAAFEAGWRAREEAIENSALGEYYKQMAGLGVRTEEESKAARLMIDDLEAQYNPRRDHSDFHTIK